MKVTIEFDLPGDNDALLDAINGARWRELAILNELAMAKERDLAMTEENRAALTQLLSQLRGTRGDAGLTFWTKREWKESYTAGVASLSARSTNNPANT